MIFYFRLSKKFVNYSQITSMKKIYFLLIAMLTTLQLTFAQCTLTNATSCTCLGGSSNCDLLPDITVSRKPLATLGSNGVIEYSQTGNGSNNGLLRISVTTPNIGHGPMETRSSNKFVCGTDTFIGTAPSLCPDGSNPKIIINQRIYHKNGNTMTYYDRPAGTMTYHPTHGHQHVDNWGVYTLRSATNDPNPLNWPIIGNGAKLAFCLLDIGACASSNGTGLCIADNGDTLKTAAQFYGNYGLGGGSYGCSATLQGISTGYYDTYVQSLDGMYIVIPPGTCNGNYYIVCQQDPDNNFLEENENNNVMAVPFTLTQQGGVVPTITPNGPTTFCPGGSVTLTASSALSYLWSNGATTQSITVNQSGNYSCTVNGNTTCSTTSAPISVTVTNFPVTASASATSVCSGTSVQLNSSSSGGGTTTQVTSFTNNTVVTIPDNNATGITSTINVSGISPATLSSGMVVSVSLNVTHTYDGDLQISLISPSNQTILLSNRRGGNGANFNNTTFSMSASTLIANGSAPFAGTYVPDGNLNSFTGNVNGSWKLKIADLAAVDVGTLNSWTLRINNQVSSTVSYAWTSLPVGFTSQLQNTSATPTQTTTYLVTATESGTGCSGTNSVTVNIINPAVSIAGNTVICPGQSTTLTASGATSYSWSPSTGLSTTTGSTVIANPSSTTTYTVIGTANGCTTTETVTITVTASPTITTSGDATICDGQSTILTVSGANSYTWSPSTGLSATTGSSVTANPAATTTYTINGTVNGCATSAVQLTVTVNPNPTLSVSGTTSICEGSNTQLTASGAASYVWSPSTGLNTSVGAIVTANPSSSMLYTVTGTTNGCSSSQQIALTVNPLPVVLNSGDETICAGASALLIVQGASSYVWSPSAGLNGTTGNNVLASPATTTTYTVTGTTNGCSSSSQLTVTVNSLPVVTTSGDVSICEGQNTVLNASGATSFLWSPATGLNATTGSTVTAAPQGTITYTVTGTTDGCNGTATITVIVNANPVINTSGNVAVCQGQYAALSATGASSYSWSPSAGLNTSTGSNVIANPNTTTQYTVTGINNGCSSTSLLTVSVNPLPIITIAASSTSICTGQSATLTASGASTYSWSPSTGLNTTTGSVVIAAPSTTTTYVATGQSQAGCSGTKSITISANTGAAPAQPGAISGNKKPCPMFNETYSIAPVNGAISYTWSFPSGVNIVSGQGTTTVTVDFTTAFSSGNINVVANGVCGVSAVRSTGIAKDAVVAPASVTGILSGLCNAADVFTAAAVTGATGYTWSVPSGVSIVSGQGTRTPTLFVSSAFSTGNLCVTADNACMSSPSRCVALKKTPASPTAISGNSPVCIGQSNVTYTIAAVAGASNYTWTVPSGSVITSGQGTTSINVTFGTKTGNVAVTASNACGSSGTSTKSITFNCRVGEGFQNRNVAISPNPTNGIINISLIDQKAGVALLKLSDMLGNVVLIKNVINTAGENTHTLDLSKFNKGVYFLKVDSGTDKQTLKVVLQ